MAKKKLAGRWVLLNESRRASGTRLVSRNGLTGRFVASNTSTQAKAQAGTTSRPNARASAPASELESRVHARENKLANVASRLGMTVDELVDQLDDTAPAILAPVESAMPAAELAALRRAGVNLAGPENDPTGVSQLAAGIARVNAFREAALSVTQAAARLGVSQGRIRQQVRAREIASVPNADGTHLLPAWQFVNDALVPGLSVVLPHADGVHPLTLAHFMTRPDPDLDVNGALVSPVEWLLGGGAPDRVAALVVDLHLAA